MEYNVLLTICRGIHSHSSEPRREAATVCPTFKSLRSWFLLSFLRTTLWSFRYHFVRRTEADLKLREFLKALQEGRWGNFSAILRPFWNTGGEMGRWDKELVPLIPKTCRIFASAGAGFDWADVDVLAERGEFRLSFCAILVMGLEEQSIQEKDLLTLEYEEKEVYIEKNT